MVGRAHTAAEHCERSVNSVWSCTTRHVRYFKPQRGAQVKAVALKQCPHVHSIGTSTVKTVPQG